MLINVLYFYIILITSSLISCSLLPQYYTCNNKIYVDFNTFSQYQLNSLCSIISSKDKFVLLLTTSQFASDYEYTLSTQTFLNSQCIYTNHQCNRVYAISIYATAGRALIVSGTETKANQYSKQRAIDAIIAKAKYSNYYDAFLTAVNILSDADPDNVIVIQPSTTTTSTSRFGFFSIVIFIICPIICIICICYFMMKTKSENATLVNTNNVYDEDNNTYGIHLHLCQLEELIKEIRKSSPPIISINKCLICMQNITIYQPQTTTTQYIEMNRVNDTSSPTPNPIVVNTNIYIDNNNTRFGCQHVYHTQCLNKHRLNCCLMCTDNISSRETVPNTSDTQVIDEGHIKTFIQHVNFLYSQQELNEYVTVYPSEYDTFNTTLLLGLGTTWGISGGNTTIVNNYNYNYVNNDIYGQNPIQGNQQYAIGGMYEPPVIDNSTNMNNNNTYEMNAIEGHFTNENNVPSNIDTNMNTGCEINTATFGDSSNAGGGDIAVDGGSF